MKESDKERERSNKKYIKLEEQKFKEEETRKKSYFISNQFVKM